MHNAFSPTHKGVDEHVTVSSSANNDCWLEWIEISGEMVYPLGMVGWVPSGRRHPNQVPTTVPCYMTGRI